MSESTINRKYGWKPGLPDVRDHYYGAVVIPSALPDSIDMRAQCPAIQNQLQTSACTAHAISGAIALDHEKQGLGSILPSRLFIYYEERVIDGTVDSDCGATLRAGINVVYKLGVPNEEVWPFDESNVTVKPPLQAYSSAGDTKVTSYQKLSQDINMFKSALAVGSPVVFGFSVYTEFEAAYIAQTGLLTMPQSSSRMCGGHAVLMVGYNDSAVTVDGCPPGHLIIRNSWGADWGMNGYFFMPFQYALNPNLATDFWSIKTVS